MKFSIVRPPAPKSALGRLLRGTHVLTPEPLGPELDGWEVLLEGLSEEDAIQAASELNTASDVMES